VPAGAVALDEPSGLVYYREQMDWRQMMVLCAAGHAAGTERKTMVALDRIAKLPQGKATWQANEDCCALTSDG